MKILFFFFSILISLFASARSLKTYSGEYDAPHKDALITIGNATYTYYQGESSRIYHGQFSYKDKRHSISGSFVDNKQNGVWIYKYTQWFIGNKCTISMTFNNGMLNGPFSISCINPKNNSIIYKINGSFSNGKLKGKVTGNNLKMDVIGNLSKIKQSTFNGIFDDDGFPTGSWILKGNAREWIESYIENDTCIVRFTNLSTGDEIKPTYEFELKPRIPNIIIEEINSALKVIVMRDTQQKPIKQFNFHAEPIVIDNDEHKHTPDAPSTNRYIITYPRRTEDILPNDFFDKAPVFQEIPDSTLRPPKGYRSYIKK